MSRRRWVPPASWAAVIVVLTSIPNPPAGPSVPNFADKVLHAVVYGVLGWLIMRALAPTHRGAAQLAIVVAMVTAFGAADEWHQQFIPGRSTEIYDWVADTIGGAMGAVAAMVAHRGRVLT